jgi:hypothetical protein
MRASLPAPHRRAVLVVLLAGLAACAQPQAEAPAGQVVADGIIVCPPPTQRCELSGAVMAGGQLLLVNDRTTTGTTKDAVLAVARPRVGQRLEAQALTALPPTSAEKFEALALSPDGRHVFAITAFDRYTLRSTGEDRFNVLLSWPADRPQEVRILGATPGGNEYASLALRRQIRVALASPGQPEGPVHVKIEGLAVLPDRLLIGVRETGASHKEARFTLALISVPWRAEAGVPVLLGSPLLQWRVEPDALPGLPRAPVGLSDLVYDAARDRLWLLTSYERDEEGIDSVAGYVWTLDRAALRRGAPPALVRDANGRPLMFSHKPEALAVLPARWTPAGRS